MKKGISQKLEKWTTADVVGVIATYFINFAIIAVIMIGAAYINFINESSESSFITYMENFKKPLYLIAVIALLLIVSVIFFIFDDKNFLKKADNSEMLFLIIEVSLVINFLIGRYVDIYLRPLAIVALLTLFLTNKKYAVFMNTVFCFLVYVMDQYTGVDLYSFGYSAIIIGFTSGIVAVFVTEKVYSRLKIILFGGIISLPVIACIALTLLVQGIEKVLRSFICGAASGILAVISFIILLPLFEGIFKRVSSFKLAELTDHKSRLIRKMITEAPGTFNHSIVVSNIAEACAIAIDEDSLLARTCAYYHDIGKLRRPEYFKENQMDGTNPHDDLTPELSTNIIKSHTVDGYQLAIKNRLPKIIADTCLQHHGTMPILYFYDKAKKLTDGEVDISEYSYSGPKPQTKIAAIVMIADGCEAATRTLKNRSRENVMKAVRKIVNDRMALGQFSECEITIKELNIIIHTVVNNLTGVYHKRIEYPKVNLDGVETELIKEDESEG